MASSVGTGILTVTVTEAITLNGYDQGSTNTLAIAAVANINKRIITTTTTEAIIIAFHDTLIAAGQFVKAGVKYIRITNVDDTNHCTLRFRSVGDHEFAVKLDKGQSFTYNGDLADGVDATMDANTGALTVALDDLEDITADAATGTVDLEVFIAST
jgi:hypothetical protein